MANHLRPSFCIIGERKCASSSFYRYLIDHPHILPCRLKEPQFFFKHQTKAEIDMEAYLSLFPSSKYTGDVVLEWPELNQDGILIHERVKYPRDPDIEYITGEASANSFDELDPRVLYKYLPDLHLILLLRNPVERAFSHHRMFLRFQEEGREFAMYVTEFANDVPERNGSDKRRGSWRICLSRHLSS